MSAMNGARSRLANIGSAMAPYKGMIQLGLYVIVAAIVVYSVYTVLFPPPDKFQQTVLTDTRPAADLQGLTVPLIPPMATGGDYSLQFWIYINNWDYKAGQAKNVFTIASSGKTAGGRPDHVSMIGTLYPNEPKMMIRVHQDTESLAAAGADSGPDFTVVSNMAALYKGTMTPGDGQTTSDYPVCDIRELDMQKWVHIAIVVSGRVIDVYMDGKLARSCVLPGIPIVEAGDNAIVLGDQNGWGGAISTVRFYGYALTPAAVYSSYQEGPAQKAGLDARFGFMGWLAERIGLNIDYAGIGAS